MKLNFFKTNKKSSSAPNVTANINTGNAESRLTNARVVGRSGMGGRCDFDATSRIGGGYPESPAELLLTVDNLYYNDWQSKKIIDIPVDDMLRNGFEYLNIPDESAKKLYKYQEDLGVNEKLRQALRMERLYGGSVIMMGLRDDIDDPSAPVDFDSIKEGDLQFMHPIPRNRVTQTSLQYDPTRPGYGKPEFYFINGHKVHHSRLLIFDGDPMSIHQNQSQYGYANYSVRFNDGFGYPVLARILDDLKRATATRQSALQLVERASVMIFNGDIQSASAFKDANQNISALKNVLDNISIYQAALINSTPGNPASLSTIAANFGALPEIMDKMLNYLGAADDIPITRFLGQSPGGLNATGESDENNYYSNIMAKNNHRLKPQIAKMLKFIIPSSGLNINEDDIEIFFPPLQVPTEIENAQIRQIDTQNVVSLVADGLISSEEALEELRQRDGLRTNPEDFPPPEMPENFDESDLNETSDFNEAIRKLKGDEVDDSSTTK